MARKKSIMKRVHPSLREAITIAKKDARDQLGLDISDVDATKMISQRYKESSFLKKDLDKYNKLL